MTAQVCIGTGALALPFAMSEGGVAFGSVGLLLIAAWNQYASLRIDALRQWTGAATYAAMAECIFGSVARAVVDVCTISTLLGVCVVYTITFATLLHDTPLALGGVGGGGDPNLTSAWREMVLCGLLVLPLACSSHLKFLANTSGEWKQSQELCEPLTAAALGLLLLFAPPVQLIRCRRCPSLVAAAAAALGLAALVAGFLAVAAFGVSEFGDCGGAPVALAPASWAHFANWFGVAAFCFGIPPLHFSLQEAMDQPRDFTRYLCLALALVWGTYVALGAGTAWLYRCDGSGIDANILSNLPNGAAGRAGGPLHFLPQC